MRTFPLSELLRGDQADGCKYRQGKSTALQLSDLHYFTLLIRMNDKPAYHSPNCVWSIKCHYSPPLAPVYLTKNISSQAWLTGWLTERVIDWQTWLLSDKAWTIHVHAFMWVLLVWGCHRLYSQLRGSGLKLDSQDQTAEEESISIKLKTPPSLLQTAEKKNGKIAQCLWVRARQRISAFRRTDGLTEEDRKEGGQAEMLSSDLFYGIETSVKRCKYLYIRLSLLAAPGAVEAWPVMQLKDGAPILKQ